MFPFFVKRKIIGISRVESLRLSDNLNLVNRKQCDIERGLTYRIEASVLTDKKSIFVKL